MALAICEALDELQEAVLGTIPGSVASDDGKALIDSLADGLVAWIGRIRNAFPRQELFTWAEGILRFRVEGTKPSHAETLAFRGMAAEIIAKALAGRSTGFEALLGNHMRVAYMVAVEDVERDMRRLFDIRESAVMREVSLQAEFVDQAIPTEVTDWARLNAATHVTAINETTKKELANTIANAMGQEQRGVADVAKAIEEKFAEMSGPRSELIATTEMNFAMSQGTVDRGMSMGAKRKKWITVGDSRVDQKVCAPNEAQSGEKGISIALFFDSGHGQPPGHPRCRCAIATFGATRATAERGFSDPGRQEWLSLIGAGIDVAQTANALLRPTLAIAAPTP